VQGYDVSVYQGSFGWAGTGVAFGYARISDGLGTIDGTFDGNWSRMKAAGVLRGAYQFFEPGEDEVAQANMMVQKVGGTLGDGDLPCMIDVEVNGGQSGGTIAAKVKSWLGIVERGTGKKPVIYTGSYFWDGNVGDTSMGSWPIWIAAYGPTCPALPNGWTNWLFWQYSDGGGSLDHDVFNGTLAQLQGLARPPNTPPKGYLDNADCTQVNGWSQDDDVPTKSIAVHVYFDGAAGASGATGVPTTADQYRKDLCTALGSCNHAFSLATPRSLMDGKGHPVYAYGIDSTGGPNTLLTNSPKSFTCKTPAPPVGAIKRWIPSPTVLSAWKLSTFMDLAHYDDATLGAVPKGPDLDATPTVVIADNGAPEVWVIDGNERRHVVDPASMAAWRFPAPTKWAATKVDAVAQGRDWPAAPLLAQASAPEVYVFDTAPPTPGADAGPSGTSGPGTDAGTPPLEGTASQMNGSSDGCDVSAKRIGGEGFGFLGMAFASMLTALRFRRRGHRFEER
jgi:GH25 family lysozyme M1 (1,4-beta-N-acetylmuramidase)